MLIEDDLSKHQNLSWRVIKLRLLDIRSRERFGSRLNVLAGSYFWFVYIERW